MYIFKAAISDKTATAQFTFFTLNADVLTNADCTELVKQYDTPSPREFPPEILNLKGRKHISQFHYSPSCEKGNVDFYFNDILDKPLQITSGSKPEREVPGGSKLIASGDVTMTTLAITDTDLSLKGKKDSILKETGSESTDNKTGDEPASEGIPSKKTSKRPLFQGDLDEEKKKKNRLAKKMEATLGPQLPSVSREKKNSLDE
ncbi:hypothetical protein Tco_0179603 [Tanacetum coccineum]